MIPKHRVTVKSNPGDFQTPDPVARYMASLIPQDASHVLEPTPGEGNLVSAIMEHRNGIRVTFVKDFFTLPKGEVFDSIVMNPPFSLASTFGAIPDDLKGAGMRVGYYILSDCMRRSNSVIALMPWFTILDSDVRMRELHAYGLKSITALPRKTFKYTRIQTCVFELERGYQGRTEFKVFERI